MPIPINPDEGLYSFGKYIVLVHRIKARVVVWLENEKWVFKDDEALKLRAMCAMDIKEFEWQIIAEVKCRPAVRVGFEDDDDIN